MKILHQLGHNNKWNRDAYTNNLAGKGFILSPVNIKPNKIKTYFTGEMLKNSFLDPQCYKLEDKKESLNAYPYFLDELQEGLHSIALDSRSEEISRKCIDFQMEFDFSHLVIPAMYSETDLDFQLKRNKSIFIDPFLNDIKNKNINKKILLTVIVHESYICSSDLRLYLLNWISSFPEIDGVYLIPKTTSEEPIDNEKFLFNFLEFINYLKEMELETYIGYTGIEGLIYSAAMPDAITVGVYKNLRSFSLNRFSKEKTGMRSPYPRIFSHIYLNWIRYDNALLMPNIESFFDMTNYNVKNFYPEGKNPHFSNPLLYLHYFDCFNRLCEKLPHKQTDRIDWLISYINNSINILIKQSDPEEFEHLYSWLKVLKKLKKNLVKKGI
ncbi:MULTISPECIES: hypothetical protein [Psychrilyobacter]|uniref:Uncharacterized protein n=1 Tax=Psychrilyobacter piezotolerans TaxID=2293438 RepID=A0ABX9KJC4_9FUSO|nr:MULTISPECIES: hypothetical protein [Psychrilyobacter]MCS5422205.1 hypothetical protein [Psychrilyobacter sp. S5]NDI77148.1 hypothetical protein [Psychrilyobacter piezotolerans]RDE64140.1 hypothetical protein DV867_04215 [Psychrilyobacter sp. S5]REI42232.1 hypothetical protein DYH56_04215 [Psychrilyobacter piezotolerans]